LRACILLRWLHINAHCVEDEALIPMISRVLTDTRQLRSLVLRSFLFHYDITFFHLSLYTISYDLPYTHACTA
jgi:hypothetical protein